MNEADARPGCTGCTTKVRPLRDCPHRGLVVLHRTPEYQCLWFQFYRAFNFYCTAIAAEPSLPSGPSLATDWAAIGVAAALETSITASAVVASATVPVTTANDDDHPHIGHSVDDCLHDDGHNDVIVDDGLTSSCSLSVLHTVDCLSYAWQA
jgi:hypothetical protein